MELFIETFIRQPNIFVKAHFTISKGESKETCVFFLAQSLQIDRVYTKDSAVAYRCISENLEFRCPTQKIILENPHLFEWTVEYHGPVNGYHTLIENDVIALNYYSAWYPTECNIPVTQAMIELYLSQDYCVVNANYDVKQQCWRYIPLDFDYNIAAFKNCRILENDVLSLFYMGSENDILAKEYIQSYKNILSFYKEIFPYRHIEKSSMVLLPQGNKYDGYRRKQLMVFGGFREDVDNFIHLLAHEAAHTWCCGANINTWEDWLNETTAEWAALLYELHTGNKQLFENTIQYKMQLAKDAPSILTIDGTRPAGVHDKGVILFYQLYLKYGQACIKNILTLFSSLTEKTTASLINTMYKSNMKPQADIIANEITK